MRKAQNEQAVTVAGLELGGKISFRLCLANS
jgi:hypothetical protein